MAPSTSSVAKGKPVLASSQLISDFAARAVDDAMGTSWASVPVGEQWIWVDLLTSHDLSHVVIFWGDNIPSSYNLEISSTGVTWEAGSAFPESFGALEPQPILYMVPGSPFVYRVIATHFPFETLTPLSRVLRSHARWRCMTSSRNWPARCRRTWPA